MAPPIRELEDDEDGAAAAGGLQGALISVRQAIWGPTVRSATASTKAWAWWVLKWTGKTAWVLGTVSLVVGFPLMFGVSRHDQQIELEKAQDAQLQSQGYTPRDIQNMRANGQLPPPQPGALPPPPQ